MHLQKIIHYIKCSFSVFNKYFYLYYLIINQDYIVYYINYCCKSMVVWYVYL